MAHVLAARLQQVHTVLQHVPHHVPEVSVVLRRDRDVAEVVEDEVERAALPDAVLEVLEGVTDNDLGGERAMGEVR